MLEVKRDWPTGCVKNMGVDSNLESKLFGFNMRKQHENETKMQKKFARII